MFVSIQKILPIYIVGIFGTRFLLCLLALGNRVLGVLLRVGEMSIKKLIGISRIFNMGWFLMLSPRMSAFTIFIFFYRVSVGGVVLIFSSGSMRRSHIGRFSGSLQNGIILILRLLRIGGFPGTLGFWGKLGARVFLIGLGRITICSILLSLSFFIILIYLNLGLIVLSMERLNSFFEERFFLVSVSSVLTLLLGVSLFSF